LRTVGWALAASGVIVLLARRISVRAVVEEYDGPSAYADGVQSIASIATSLLSELAWIGVVLGLLIVAYAVLTGPSRAAVAVRRELSPVLANAFAIWVLAIAVVLVYFAIRPSVTFQNWLPRVLIFVLFVVGVELLRRQARREFPDASIADSWQRLRTGFSARWNA
jgi:mannose/fructose/N-acetylgalactosamine-specific phosphotransferase system component IID